MANNTSRVTDELRALILSGDLEPAQRLRADALAKRMGTSRTPVREALLVLEREGLVANLPNRGAMVRTFDADDLLDLYDVRAVLEPHAALRAARRMTDEDIDKMSDLCDQAEESDSSDKRSVERQILLNNEFHGLIVEAADSPRLQEALRGNAGIPVDFRSAFWSDDDQRHRSLALHREILWGIERRDGTLAETAMRLHLEQARRFLEEVVEAGGLAERNGHS
jgi:DNA-binding GntR family transcriptional regulator